MEKSIFLKGKATFCQFCTKEKAFFFKRKGLFFKTENANYLYYLYSPVAYNTRGLPIRTPF